MKTFVKTFRGKISYKKIDKYVDLVRRTLDPDEAAIMTIVSQAHEHL